MTKLSLKEVNRVAVPVLLTVIAGLLSLLHFYTPPTGGLWTRAFFESLHVPVFGIVAACCYGIISLLGTWTLRRRLLAAFVAAAAFGALSELAQVSGPRDASAEDFLADVLGASAALLLVAAFGTRETTGRIRRWTMAFAGAGMALFAMWPLVVVSAAYIERNSQVPVLLSFDAHYGQFLRRMQNASLHIERHAELDRRIARITLGEGAWPGVILRDIWPDWRNYSSLVIELGLEDDEPLEINVRVHDREHLSGEQPYQDRFNLAYRLQPGQTTLRVPIESISEAPRNRLMDLSQMEGIVVFCAAGSVGREFLLREIRLE